MNTYTFQDPWLLLLLPVALLGFWRLWRKRPTLRFSTVQRAKAAGAGAAARLHWMPFALRALALALLVMCIARPVRLNEQTRTLTEG